MFTLIDAGGLIVAVLTGGLVVALPGLALARGFGFARDQGMIGGVVVGLALLPLLDSLLVRGLGIDAAAIVTLGLAGCGLAAGWREANPARRSALGAVVLIVWLAIVIGESVDIDVAGRLYQPFTVIDTVKHAATTQAILDSGAPPHDPFFLRPQQASYYYFFYSLAALVQTLGFGAIDARAAFGGMVFWTGLGLFGLVRLTLERLGVRLDGDRRRTMLTIAVLAAGGLDILGVLRMGLVQGIWLADPASWNEQVTNWLESLLWVPHHVTALIAGMVGLLGLAEIAAPQRRPTRSDVARATILAGCAFASSFGLSVWVTLGWVATAAAWGLVLAVERRWHAFLWLALAGLLAAVLATPQIVDLLAGRAVTGAPAIVPTVRAFTPVDGLIPAGPLRLLGRLVALPVNYYAGFGALASGAVLYWRMQRQDRAPPSEVGRLLVIAAGAGLILGAFLKSTLFNNDLGWRVVLLPLLAGTVWTIAALDAPTSGPRRISWSLIPRFTLALMALGWMTNAYALASLRAYPWLSNEPQFAFMAADPATERALRVAYAWADRNLPTSAVLQHEPARPRAFAFALYGRHRVAVADSFGALYGAVPAAVTARIAAIAPIFQTPLSDQAVRAIATTNGIDDLVVTADDPIWSRSDSFIWRAKSVFASARVRIIPVAALSGPPAPATRDASKARSAAVPAGSSPRRLGG